jgi:hypothetical protein
VARAPTIQCSGIMTWNTAAAQDSGMEVVKAMTTGLPAKRNAKMCVFNHLLKVGFVSLLSFSTISGYFKVKYSNHVQFSPFCMIKKR